MTPKFASYCVGFVFLTLVGLGIHEKFYQSQRYDSIMNDLAIMEARIDTLVAASGPTQNVTVECPDGCPEELTSLTMSDTLAQDEQVAERLVSLLTKEVNLWRAK